MNESQVHQFRVVKDVAASRVRKYARIAFDVRKPWWWLLVFIGLIISILLSLYYLPIFWPERFKEDYLEKQVPQGLTVYYPPRMVSGHSYLFDFIHEVPTLPTTSPITATFHLDTNWAGANFQSPVLVFLHQTNRYEEITKTLTIKNVLPPIQYLEVSILDQNANRIESIPVKLVSLPDYAVWLISLLTVNIAILGKLGYSIYTSLKKWIEKNTIGS